MAPGVVVPGVVELPVEGEPGFGLLADPPAAPGVPGKFPHGPPLGLLPGFVFGLIVEGVVPLPGVGGFVEFEPGTVDGVVEFGVVELGLVEFGVAELGDVLPGGVAVVPPGVWLCPAPPELPVGELPPAGALCAISHVAQNRSVESKVNLVADIWKASCAAFSDPFHCQRSLV